MAGAASGADAGGSYGMEAAFGRGCNAAGGAIEAAGGGGGTHFDGSGSGGGSQTGRLAIVQATIDRSTSAAVTATEAIASPTDSRVAW